jgi:hypothetical protein
MVTLTNPDYPHTAVIKRAVKSSTPPFTITETTIWSGAVDCQIGIRGGTSKRETVFVSDYTIYSQQIGVDLQVGDKVTVTLKTGSPTIICTIAQHTTDNLWEVDGVIYGTTMWVNQVRA